MILTYKSLPFVKRWKYLLKRKPRLGTPIWYRGQKLLVTELDKLHMRFTFENDKLKVTGSLQDVRYSTEFPMWYLPGLEGEKKPKYVRGKLTY